jgi:hypothetical protein
MSKSRYEQEIDEILSKYEEEKGRAPRPPQGKPPREFRPATPLPPRKGLTPPRSMPDIRRLSSGQYMLAAFGVAILAIVVRGLGVPSAIVTMMIILSAVLFLVPILLNYTRGGSSGGSAFPREEKRWRGQVIDINTRRNVTDDPFAGIKRWLRRR